MKKPWFNVNRILRFSIRSKLVVAFLMLATVPLSLSGLLAVYVHTEGLEHAELEHLEHDVQTVRERTDTFLSGVQSDVRFLVESRLFRHFVETDDEVTRRLLLGQIADLAQSKGLYYQMRLLDWVDGERLVVRAGPDQYRALTPDPQAAVEYYRYLLSGEPPDEIVSVAAQLRDEEGGVISVISHALPIRGTDGQTRGTFVVDLFASHLFSIVDEAHENAGGDVALLDAGGHYVYHSALAGDWGRLLASRQEANISRDFPADVGRQIMSQDPGILVTDTEVIAHAPILKTEADGFGSYTLLMSVPRDLILDPVRRFQWVFGGLLGIIVLASTGLAFVAASQLTRPIATLQQGARVIADGQFGQRLSIETYDEIQQLAESYNTMASALEAREGRIRQNEALLEATVESRTAELAAEKGKLQAIFDAVPSAIVLLDPHMKVLSASRAFERICGSRPDAAIGQSYERFIPRDLEQDSPAETALATGRIQVGVQNLRTAAEGTGLQIERVAIPVTVEGRVEQVIEMVTDVTERKEMEARIIQSEKLATTGEMAALIAHELRNSLTSVKMILQLELERQSLPEEEREALGVANGAVRRMETVVADLLEFARPSPPELQLRQIQSVLEDAVSLIQHQFDRQGISIRITAGATTPDTPIDGDQLKEVLVNLLLNAAQATGQGGQVALASRISSDGHWAIIDVEDNGPGVPRDHRERVFDPFYTTKVHGTGLGLSTARRTVEAHGGRIEVGTSASGGARFSIRLPTRVGGDEA